MLRFNDFDFRGFKPHRSAAETGAGERGWVVMLSERPYVRVHNDPAILCTAREAEGRETPGRL